MKAIAPCPFCGGTDLESYECRDELGFAWDVVQCSACSGCGPPAKDPLTALDKWNERGRRVEA